MRGTRHRRFRHSWVALVLVLAACSSSVPSSTVAQATLPQETTATTSTSTTTTTTTIAPTPAELREAFAAELDERGWTTYTDSDVGWSIRHPGDWEVFYSLAGELGLRVESSALIIVPWEDVDPAMEGSLDYLVGDVEADIESGLLRESTSDISWLDHDFDGEEGPLDIAWIEAEFAVDFATGEPLAEDDVLPTRYYVFYDPSARPNYAYLMWTVGNDAALVEALPEIALSFEPPAYPTPRNLQLVPPAAGGSERWLTDVRELEEEARNDGWTAWTTEFTDEQLLANLAEWCGEAASVGDIFIEDASGWMEFHPLADQLTVVREELGYTEDVQSYITYDFLLPLMVRYGACPALQPAYDEEAVISDSTVVFSITWYELNLDEVLALHGTPEDDLDMRESFLDMVFVTCTNIDNRSASEIAAGLSADFDVPSSQPTPELVASVWTITAMRLAATHVCPARAELSILAWEGEGYPFDES